MNPTEKNSIAETLRKNAAVIPHLIQSIPDERIQQTMQVFYSEGQKDSEAMDLCIEHLAGYWAKYNAENPVTF